MRSSDPCGSQCCPWVPRVGGGATPGRPGPRGESFERWQHGQRGSHPTITRAMASRIVANESSKWRSGRAVERVVFFLPSVRGGKMPRTFGDDERVAAEDDGDMMVPAGERAALEVVEPELPLELLVRVLGPPALLDGSDDPLLAHAARQRRQGEVRRLRLPRRPLEHQPDGLVLRRVDPVVVRDLDAPEAEARLQLPPSPFPPRHATKRAGAELLAQALGAHRFAVTTAGGVEEPDLRWSVNPHGVVEAVQTHRLPEEV